MNAALVDVRGLEVFAGARLLAHVPELRVEAGQCSAIVGESGSGKTTTLMAILGLHGVAGLTARGKIMLCGLDVLATSQRALGAVRGRRAALVMQSPQAALNPTLRLGTLGRRALRRAGFSPEEADRRIADALHAVVLDQALLRRYPHQVSGGQAQRFALAMAVALGAELIVADEPTSALDMTVQAEVMALLRRLQRDRGLAVLLVSHDLALVSGIARDVLVMRDGQVVETGPVSSVLLEPKEAYTRELLAATPRLDGAA
ncbi:MAG TPA: ABC transporter ATP-binding protein [Streptosporangiaceae bacterium]|jgi:ABC-type glutathione transport system ATPase component